MSRLRPFLQAVCQKEVLNETERQHLKGNISLRGASGSPEQSGVTETVCHADEQCFLFAHICMRKGSKAATSPTNWLGALTPSCESGSDGDSEAGRLVRIS